MIILGEHFQASQNYLLTWRGGWCQAQRLRARSFFVQLLAETAACGYAGALEWPLDSIVLSGAGKFLLQGQVRQKWRNALRRTADDQ